MLTPTFTGPATAWISRVGDGLGMPKSSAFKARISRFLLDGGRSALCVGSANKTTARPGNARAVTSYLFDARPFHVHPPTTCMILHSLGSLRLICAPWGPPDRPNLAGLVGLVGFNLPGMRQGQQHHGMQSS
jgi:hypothetical protein